MQHKTRILLGGIGLAAIMALPFAVSADTQAGSTSITKPGPTAVINHVRLHVITGTVNSISGSDLTVASGSKTYIVDTSSAKLIRRYGAAMLLSDFQSGDKVTVTMTVAAAGTLGAMNSTTTPINITATIVRDNSLQAHNGTFVGTIQSVSGSGFALQSKARGVQTINTTSSTVFKVGSSIGSLSSVATGQTVTVSGVWDRTNSNVTATKVTVRVLGFGKTATLQSSTTNSLIVATNDGKTYTVDTTNAKFYYKGWSKGDSSMLQNNDSIRITGTYVSGSTNVTAKTVHDMSQKKVAPNAVPKTLPPTAQ